jgi:hypothetical protein
MHNPNTCVAHDIAAYRQVHNGKRVSRLSWVKGKHARGDGRATIQCGMDGNAPRELNTAKNERNQHQKDNQHL